MPDYKKMYLHLFNSVTDALAALAERDPERAERILKKAQIDAEETYIEAEK